MTSSSRVPICEAGTGNRGSGGVHDEDPAVLGPGDEAAVSERAERGEEVSLAHVQGVAQVLGRQRVRGGMEAVNDAGLERIVGGEGRVGGAVRGALDDEVGGITRDEAEAEGRRRGGTAMLDDQDAVVAVAGEVEAGIEPRREITGAAEL